MTKNMDNMDQGPSVGLNTTATRTWVSLCGFHFVGFTSWGSLRGRPYCGATVGNLFQPSTEMIHIWHIEGGNECLPPSMAETF